MVYKKEFDAILQVLTVYQYLVPPPPHYGEYKRFSRIELLKEDTVKNVP